MSRVVVSLPTYRCTSYLREAVESILRQTHGDLVCVVVNDADPDERFETLADLADPRLVRFDLAANRGPYYAHEVVRRATSSWARFLAVQDADDVSMPHRLETLVRALEARPDAPGAASMIGGDYSGKSHSAEYRELTKGFRHRVCHAGLWRMWALTAIGGYYGGYRIGWDTMIVSALALYGEQLRSGPGEPIEWVPEVLYSVRSRDGSLTRSSETGKTSEQRQKLSLTYRTLWREMFARRGHMDLISAIQNRMTKYVSEEDRQALDRDAARLRALVPT